MARKPQQQTLSIRISDAIRDFLERSKDVISSARGESVSISDVAKFLLESAKDDRLDSRLEAAELQNESAESLWNIRRKWEQMHDLSRAEWIFMSQYVQVACEEITENPGIPLPESYAVLLEALLDIRALRLEHGVGLDRYYLENIGIDDKKYLNDRQLDPDIVPRVIGQWVSQLRTAKDPAKPIYAGRAFYVAMRDERLPDLVSINKALFPHMNTLFRLAARGHWIREKRPIGPTPRLQITVDVIPSLAVAGFKLAFAVGSEGDVSILLQIAERDLMYPLGRYPEIREFFAMTERLKPNQTWRGNHFFADTVQETAADPVRYYFRRYSDGVTIGFSADEWHSLKSLVSKAMKLPALQKLFTELSLVYGEL